MTAPTVTDASRSLARRLGKTPVVAADTPGFIVNRVQRAYYLEAFRILEEGLAEIDGDRRRDAWDRLPARARSSSPTRSAPT